MTHPTEAGERERLKSCPFCGADAEYDRISSPQSRYFGVRVICSACGAGVTMRHSKSMEEADEAVAAAWNRRAANLLRTEPGGELAGAERLKALEKAVKDSGPVPQHHHRIMQKHREEWPRLWEAIDALLDTFDP